MAIKIASWNVNSVNARLPNIIKYCDIDNPDILLLQETKCLTERFPHAEVEALGYNQAIYGQKTYNGVAILSKYPITDVVNRDFGDSLGEARYIEAVIQYQAKCIKVASIYVPNGSAVGSAKFQNKLKFFDDLRQYLLNALQADDEFIIGGDFNVAMDDIDVYDPISLSNGIGFHIEERKKIRSILNDGFIDIWRLFNTNVREYSWWDYRDRESFKKQRGMRIDYLLAAPKLIHSIIEVGIAKECRISERPSDHVPVWGMLE